MHRVSTRAILLAAAAASLSSQASAAVTVWQGVAVVEEVDPVFGETCTQIGSEIPLGSTLRLIFRPRNVGDNGAATTLLFLDATKSSVVRLETGTDFSGDNANAFAMVLSEGGGRTANYAAAIKDASTTPATITATTPRVVLKGWVSTLFAQCTLRFSANLLLH